jgi:hypothetical protein
MSRPAFLGDPGRAPRSRQFHRPVDPGLSRRVIETRKRIAHTRRELARHVPANRRRRAEKRTRGPPTASASGAQPVARRSATGRDRES